MYVKVRLPKFKMLYLWVVFLTLIPPATSQPSLPTAIFLLGGQSNMAGRGGVFNDTTTHNLTWDGVIPSECSSTSSILRLTADLIWVQAHEPLHADIDRWKTNGVGPAMPFAHHILTHKSYAAAAIGLVPCAIGGTSITQWQRGSILYTHLLNRARASLQSGGAIKALLWYQGENDTVDREDSELYGTRLNKFFTDIRSDLQAPLLPIIQVGIASGVGAYIDGVRSGQFGIHLPNLWTVDARGLTFELDGLHLTTSAQVKLGGLLADAFLRIPSDPLASPLTNTAPCQTTFNFAVLRLLTLILVHAALVKIRFQSYTIL